MILKSKLEFLTEKNLTEVDEFLIRKKCYKKGSKWYSDKSIKFGTNDNRVRVTEKSDGDGEGYELLIKFGVIKETFSFASNKKSGIHRLDSCKGFPSEVGEDVLLGHNYITSLKGFPNKVGGRISLNDNKLTSLVGLPKEFKGELRIESNPIENLKGLTIHNCPDEIWLSETNIKNLKGLPSNVKSVSVHGCRKLETITDILETNVESIGSFAKANKLTTNVIYEHLAFEMLKNNNDKSEFFKNLIDLLLKNKVDLESYKYWPKGFLTDTLINSVKGINKFKL